MFAPIRLQGDLVPTTAAHKAALVHSDEHKATSCAMAWQQGHLLIATPNCEIRSTSTTHLATGPFTDELTIGTTGGWLSLEELFQLIGIGP